MWVNFLRTRPAYERCKFFCPAFIVVSLQWGESCPNVCAFTLIQKRSFNCIFKPELENQLSNALFVFFVEDGFSSLSLLKTICFLLAQQWLTEHWLGHFGKILSDPRESVSLPCISHSACTGTLCRWVVIRSVGNRRIDLKCECKICQGGSLFHCHVANISDLTWSESLTAEVWWLQQVWTLALFPFGLIPCTQV